MFSQEENSKNEIDELNSILKQREQVVRQFQLEKTSTQEQINNLQLKVRSVQQQLQSVQASLIESKAENEIFLSQKNKLESEKNKLEQKLKLKKRSKTKKIEPVKSGKNILSSKVHPQPESYFGNVNPIGFRSCYDEGKRVAETLMMDYHRQCEEVFQIKKLVAYFIDTDFCLIFLIMSIHPFSHKQA